MVLISGHSSLIGHSSGKILGYETRVKRCAKCRAGQLPESHDCRVNFSGSAKAMEADMAVSLIARNEDLKQQGVRIDVLIGDDDCATISQVRRAVDYPIVKWSDVNHAGKQLISDLHSARPKISQAVIDYFSYNFGVSLKTNKGDEAAVKAAFQAMTPHAFDDHTKCGSWCGYVKDPVNYKHQHLPNNEGLTGKSLISPSQGKKCSNLGLKGRIFHLLRFTHCR